MNEHDASDVLFAVAVILGAILVSVMALTGDSYAAGLHSSHPGGYRHANPAELVIRGARRHRHRSVGKCLDPKGHWYRGCK